MAFPEASARSYLKHRPHGVRWKRYEKPQPGSPSPAGDEVPGAHLRYPERPYQFTAIDDCTRLRVLKVHGPCNQQTAIQFINEVVRRRRDCTLVSETQVN